MMYYLFRYDYCLFQTIPKTYSIFTFISFAIFYNVFLYMMFRVFHELYIKFYDRTSVDVFTHGNPWNNEWIVVPLDYKIFDLKNTYLRIAFFSLLGFGPLLVIRFIRLGTKIHLISYYKILSEVPLICNICMFISLIHYIFLISLLYFNVYARLYKELKKLYIYLLQYGGRLDKDNFNKSMEAYLVRYFLQPLEKYTSSKWILLFYKLRKNIKNNNKYLSNKKIKNLILFLINEIELSVPLIYKIILYIVPILVLCYDLKFNNYKLFYTYYVLFYLFIYKQIYNIMHFSWYHHPNTDTILAFYYYKKLTILFEKTEYAENIRDIVNSELIAYAKNPQQIEHSIIQKIFIWLFGK